MTVHGVSTSGKHSITPQVGRPTNTLGYSGNKNERYVINYGRNSVQTHRTETFIRRLLGR